MPVEIRELIIRTNVASQGAKKTGELDAQKLEEMKKQIVEECVSRLRKQQQRKSSR